MTRAVSCRFCVSRVTGGSGSKVPGLSRSRRDFIVLRQELKDLDGLCQAGKERFLSDNIFQAAATHMLQVTIEALLDICTHIIAGEGWGLPKSYTETVTVAARDGIVPPSMEETYKAMVRFRNNSTPSSCRPGSQPVTSSQNPPAQYRSAY